MADHLVVEPEPIFVGSSFCPGTGRPAEQAHAGRRLKDVGRERASVDVEFNAQVSRVGDPGDLVAVVENDRLRDESDEYGAFCHVMCDPDAMRGQSS
jgi:hypothetical protein